MRYLELFWAGASDTHNAAVPNAMSRQRFRDLFSNLLLANNAEINADRYYKMLCLFDMVNCNFKKLFSASDHGIDESMIPYFGKHGTKHFICGEQIRFRFKLFALLQLMDTYFTLYHIVELTLSCQTQASAKVRM